MLLTQAQAFQKLRETGMSYRWCEAAIEAMKKIPDGARAKVNERDVQDAIAKITTPVPAKPIQGIRPFSQKTKDRLQAG